MPANDTDNDDVQSMDQLVHDFNTALDETAGSNSSSRSSASRRKVSRDSNNTQTKASTKSTKFDRVFDAWFTKDEHKHEPEIVWMQQIQIH